MNWKYKHFHRSRTFAADRDVVRNAARTFMTQSLGWNLTNETSEGFTAEGYSFTHRGIANIQIQSVADGTNVDVELAMERAGPTGFMLFDVGGYYNIQIGHWLDGIQELLHQELTDSQGTSAIPAPAPRNKTTACLFNGCIALIVLGFGLWVLVNLVFAVVGLITGHLILIGRGGDLHVHGAWARVLSTAILLFGIWIVWRILKRRRKPRRNP